MLMGATNFQRVSWPSLFLRLPKTYPNHLTRSLRAGFLLGLLAEFAVHRIDGRTHLTWDLLHVPSCHFQLGMTKLSLDVSRVAVLLEVRSAGSAKCLEGHVRDSHT